MRCQDGREDIKDDEHSGYPAHANLKKVKEMIMNERRNTIKEVTDGISIGSCHEVFSEVLGMKRVTSKFVPKL